MPRPVVRYAIALALFRHTPMEARRPPILVGVKRFVLIAIRGTFQVQMPNDGALHIIRRSQHLVALAHRTIDS